MERKPVDLEYQKEIDPGVQSDGPITHLKLPRYCDLRGFHK